MYREQVAKVLQAMHHTHTNETVTELTELFNKESVYSEDSVDLGYIVREPIINETFGDIRFRRLELIVQCVLHRGWNCFLEERRVVCPCDLLAGICESLWTAFTLSRWIMAYKLWWKYAMNQSMSFELWIFQTRTEKHLKKATGVHYCRQASNRNWVLIQKYKSAKGNQFER